MRRNIFDYQARLGVPALARGIPSAPLRPVGPPRLPSIPAPPYDPPVTARVPVEPPAETGLQKDLEVTRVVKVPFGALVVAGGVTPEVSIATTSRRWNAVDVYFEAPAGIETTVAKFRVKIYAIGQMGRVLVATGWWDPLAQNVTAASSAKLKPWIAGARGVAERWEVTLQSVNIAPVFINTVPPPQVAVTLVASDLTTPVPDWVGVAQSDGGGGLPSPVALPVPNTNNASQGSFETEIVGLWAHNTNAALRWIHCVDASDVAAAAGVGGIFIQTVQPGQQINIGPEFFRGYRFGVNGLVVGPSTTFPTFTSAPSGEVRYKVWYR